MSETQLQFMNPKAGSTHVFDSIVAGLCQPNRAIPAGLPAPYAQEDHIKLAPAVDDLIVTYYQVVI